ncbi:mediator complex subunit 13 C-terminal-domain-containing protein [Cytidiella melzeri]|nr:mediator complex subunit 13 C-terminal-domain-containing protein [Cytidiella melzeri]
MATKHTHNSHTSDSTGLLYLAQSPPKISLNSPLLASEINLPPHPLIHCWVYTPLNNVDPLQTLEAARRKVVLENKSLPVVKALLPRVRVGRDSQSSVLYVFAVGSSQTSLQPDTSAYEPNINGLVCLETSHFSPAGLYPCSAGCSMQLEPCPSCLLARPEDRSSPSWSSACLLPRVPLRQPYTEFICAVRDRLVEDVTQASISSKHSSNTRQAVRYKRGFLLGPTQATSTEWGIGWDYSARQRSLVYCELQLHLYPTRILLHPVLQSAQLLPLLTTSHSSVVAGDPITLLPHGIPAYYLNTYTGPVGSLTLQFDDALIGLGAGDWKTPLSCLHQPHATGARYGAKFCSKNPTYVIAWLAVQNRHGEDKGMPIVWPSSLCVVPSSNSTHPRPPLDFIPMISAQLLASPPAHAARPPSLGLPSTTLAPPLALPEPRTPSPVSANPPGSFSVTLSERAHSVPGEGKETSPTPRPLRPSLHRSPTADSLRAFRTLTITHKCAQEVASEVRTYVDAVTRERERERERLKREREGGSVSRIASGSIKPVDKTPGFNSASLSSRKAQIEAEASAPKQEIEQLVDFALTPAQSSYTAPSDVHSVTLEQEEPSFPTDGLLSSGTDMPSNREPVEPVIKSELIPPAIAQPNNIDTSANSFDPFPALDSGWNPPGASNDFMGMSLDNYDIGMGFSMGMNEAGDGGNGGDAFNMDDGFGAFTDDDFNFFDSPTTTTRAPATTSSMLTPSAGPAPLIPGVSDSIQISGSGFPSATSQATSIPWLNQTLGVGMTPTSLDASTPAVSPELVPSTPSHTPPSHSAPVTPSVMLADQLQLVHIRRSSVSSAASNNFDPIPFAQSHRMADGKYAQGKFALTTSPPDDEDMTMSRALPSSSSFSWHLTYRTATDPRIGIVRRLAGAKRKRLSDLDGREDRKSLPWFRENEEWATESVLEEPESDGDEAKSNSEPDDDDAMDEDWSRPVSRARTPPPSYLPLGPTLIQTQFQHSLLLPLCMPLRPPGTGPEVATGTTAPLISAPTPVSPAAILGAPSERSKALEGAAQILIKEVVENSVWGDCWRASLLAMQGSGKSSSDIWMSDVQGASQLLGVVADLEAQLTVGKTFVADDMQELQPPSFTVTKADGVIQILPPALRFWEKLGLHPRAGAKNVVAFVFFEGSDDEAETEIADWLDKLSAVYTSKHFGTHICGRAAACTRNGLVPVSFDTFRKTLVSFVASLPELDTPMVFYIVTPTRMMNLASSSLRQVLSAVKKVKKTYPEAPILIHLLPESLIQGALHNPTLQHAGFETVADAIYERALLPVDRAMSRALLPADDKTRALFSEPAFALAGSIHRKVTYSLEAHPSTLDVTDRNLMLHVAYCVSECGKWLFAACIDERGDAHDLRAWIVPDDDSDSFIANNVWEFSMSTATKAHVEWRVILAKLGAIGVAELHAWQSRLDAAAAENQHLPPVQVLFTTAEFDDPWSFIASDDSATQRHPLAPHRAPKNPTGVVFADISSTFYSLKHKVPSMSSSCIGCASELAFIPDTEDDRPLEELQIRSLHTSTLARVPAGTDHTQISMLRLNLIHSMHSVHASHIIADEVTLDAVTRNYHDLAVLTGCRWKLNANPVLPFHLAALEVVSSALSRSDIATD